MCSASTIDLLQWRVEHGVGDSDSSRLLETGRRVGTHVASTVSSFETDPESTGTQSPSTAALSTTARRAASTCRDDDSVRRRNGRTCAQMQSDGYCAYAGRRRNWGGEAADTCKTSCGSAIGACVTAPTISTIPTLPDQSELNPTCNVHVSSTSGSDSDTCGSSSSSACGSIQQGIDRAGAYNTVCVHAGGWPSNCTVV